MARVHPALPEDHWYAPPPLEVDAWEAAEARELAAGRNLFSPPAPKGSTMEVSSSLL